LVVAAAKLPEIKTRKRRKIKSVCRILRDLSDLERRDTMLSQKQILHINQGVSSSCLSRWKRDSMLYFQALNDGRGDKYNLTQATQVWFHPQEVETYMRFVERRRVLGYKTTDAWIRSTMLELVAEFMPPLWYKFTASNGWCCGFKRRYDIKLYRRNNKKNSPISERIEDVQDFHRWLLMDLQMSYPQTCPIYGRFAADHIFHMDQVPLPFCLDLERSLSMKGEPVFMQLPGSSGLDKRQATLQITIRAGGRQIIRMAIIFRGKGIVLSETEQACYAELAPYLKVHFQPNAWADGRMMHNWLSDFVQDLNIGGVTREVLLGMDRHGAQRTASFRDSMNNFSVVPAYTPADCTDVCAPVDHHVGYRMKQLMSGFYHEALEKNADSWNLPPCMGGLSAAERRMHMAS
jgi:hypothetical protein